MSLLSKILWKKKNTEDQKEHRITDEVFQTRMLFAFHLLTGREKGFIKLQVSAAFSKSYRKVRGTTLQIPYAVHISGYLQKGIQMYTAA